MHIGYGIVNSGYFGVQLAARGLKQNTPSSGMICQSTKMNVLFLVLPVADSLKDFRI
jgi:hypothetical protein